MLDLLLAGLPAELLSVMCKEKLTNPGTLRSYPRSALGISTGVLPVPESTSCGLFPASAPDPNTCVVEPEDPGGLPRIAEGQGGSGHDGLTGTIDANEETSDEGQRLLRESSVLGREGDERIMKSAEPERVDGLMFAVAVRSDVLSGTSVSRIAEHADGLPRSGLDSHSSGHVLTWKRAC